MRAESKKWKVRDINLIDEAENQSLLILPFTQAACAAFTSTLGWVASVK